MDAKTRKTLHSSKKTGGKDEWGTPKSFFNKLKQRFPFTLDPCADVLNACCPVFFTEQDDGLSKDWSGHYVFVNPPYSQNRKWLEKCYEEGQKPSTLVACLVPARTDVKWFHEFAMKACEIIFVEGRLTFELDGKPILDKNGRPQSAPFPSVVLIFKQNRSGIMPTISTMKRK